MLALMYGEGSSVPQNSARMIELLTEAANDGYHFAQYRLAKAYLDGEGVPGRADPALGIPDPAQAVTWFTRAADAGNLDAALELAGLYADPNSGLHENPAEQLRLTQMAVDAGLPSAIAALGVLYETGRGVERQPARAAALYIEALETGKVRSKTCARARRSIGNTTPPSPSRTRSAPAASTTAVPTGSSAPAPARPPSSSSAADAPSAPRSTAKAGGPRPAAGRAPPPAVKPADSLSGMPGYRATPPATPARLWTFPTAPV
ncbi:MAG: tetratricopeptide repeat protein [Paracoccaceae bacterium]